MTTYAEEWQKNVDRNSEALISTTECLPLQTKN
jgi:hypothetical protein